MAEQQFRRFELRLLGTCDLRAPDGRRVSSVLSQPRRLALLAYLGLAKVPVSRASIAALFWPESDEARARNSLSQAVFFLRRSLEPDLIQAVEGDRLWVPPELLRFDAREVLFTGEITPEIVALQPGDFLPGWNADDSQPLQEWLDTKRRELHERVEAAGDVSAGMVPAPEPVVEFESDPTAIKEASHRHPAPNQAAPSQEAKASGPDGGTRTRRQLGLVLLLLVLAVVGGWMARRATSTPVRGLLMVLMPRIQAMPDGPQLLPDAVHNELLAQLTLPDGMRMTSASSANTLPDLMRQFGMLESREQPGWALEVDVRANGELIRVTFRLYEGPPPWPVTYSDVFSIQVDADPLVVLPQRIAEGVADGVANIFGR